MVRLPDHIASAVAEAVSHAGAGPVTSVVPISGGCISPAARVDAGGGSFFVKWAESAEGGRMFESEAAALETLGTTGTVATPQVVALGTQFILLEWLPSGRADHSAWQRFGATLARLHRTQAPTFGWDRSNYIGSLPQQNERSARWSDFWREQRLTAQLKLALEKGVLTRTDQRAFDTLFNELDALIEAGQQDGASLLHGDLWSGNVHATPSGIALIDPSTYFGHREVDLAMADLFGGFPASFWESYEEAWPLRGGWQMRRSIYQLYYLLVHVNLFGGGYLRQTRNALERVLKS